MNKRLFWIGAFIFLIMIALCVLMQPASAPSIQEGQGGLSRITAEPEGTPIPTPTKNRSEKIEEINGSYIIPFNGLSEEEVSKGCAAVGNDLYRKLQYKFVENGTTNWLVVTPTNVGVNVSLQDSEFRETFSYRIDDGVEIKTSLHTGDYGPTYRIGKCGEYLGILP